MPLQEPWRNFDVGHDIIYGLQEDRLAFVSFLTGGKPFALLRRPFLFLDAYKDLDQELPTGSGPKAAREREFRNVTMLSYPEAFTTAHSKERTPNALWRKKSKAGLLHAVRQRIHVHFVLDVMAESESQLAVTKKTNDKTTGAELHRAAGVRRHPHSKLSAPAAIRP